MQPLVFETSQVSGVCVHDFLVLGLRCVYMCVYTYKQAGRQQPLHRVLIGPHITQEGFQINRSSHQASVYDQITTPELYPHFDDWYIKVCLEKRYGSSKRLTEKKTLANIVKMSHN